MASILASELIRQALILANVLDPEDEMQGVYETTGLEVLNDIINQWSSLPTYLQTYSREIITTTPQTYTYTVSTPITQILEANLLDSNKVLSLLRIIDLKRQNTLNYALSQSSGMGRPATVFSERLIDTTISPPVMADSTTIYLFPVPDQIYTCDLKVKKVLSPLTQSQMMTEISTAYQKPLKYQMALDLSNIFVTALSPRFDKEYDKQMLELEAANKQDTSVLNLDPFAFHGRRYRPWGGYGGGYG
jgi:hypothetical protein